MSDIKMFSTIKTTTWAVILMASLWFWSGPFCCYGYSAKYDSKSDNNNDQDLNIHHYEIERVKSAVSAKWSDVEKIVSSKKFQNDDDRIEINIFLLILNPNVKNFPKQQKRMSKHQKNKKLTGHDDNDHKIISQFQYSALHFHLITDEYNLIKDNDVGKKKLFHFIVINNDDGNSPHRQYNKMFNYLRQHSAIEERTIIDKWQLERHPFMLVKLSNKPRGANVQIMKNFDKPHAIMMIFWFGKVTHLPLLRYTGIGHNQLSNTVNILIILISLISFIMDQRRKRPYLQQFTSLPALLFPIGFVWSQIHGDSDKNGQNLFGSIISFSLNSSAQFLSESFLIMTVNFTFSYCLYVYTQLISNDYKKLKPDASDQSPKRKQDGKINIKNNNDNNRYATCMLLFMGGSFFIVNLIFRLKLNR